MQSIFLEACCLVNYPGDKLFSFGRDTVRQVASTHSVRRQTEVLERDRVSIGPQGFEIVILASVLIEQMHDEAAVIEHDPATFLVSLDSHALIAHAFFECVVDLLADRVELPATRSGGDDKEIELGGLAADVEHEHIGTVVFDRDACGFGGEFSRILDSVGPNRATRRFHRVAPWRVFFRSGGEFTGDRVVRRIGVVRGRFRHGRVLLLLLLLK